MYFHIKNLKYFLFILLGVLLFTFPRHFQIIKTIILFLLFVIGGLEIRNKVKISNYVIIWFTFYLFFAFIWSIYGIINKNPGVIDVFRVEFVWTLVLFFFTLFVSIDKETIIKMIYGSSFISSIIGLYMILQPVIGNIWFLNWIPFEPVRNINGLIRTSLPNIAFMSFLFPVLLFLKSPSKKHCKIFYHFTLILSFLFILFAGRRAIQITASFFLIIFLFQNIPKLNLQLIGYVLFFLVIFYFIQKNLFHFIDFGLYYDMYINKLLENLTQEKRYIQMIELLKHFTKHPIFGVGFGKGIPTHIANPEKPWRYELTYFLYLYQTGIVGISLFFGLFISLFIKLRKLDSVGKALSMGLFGYLMASSTNSYLISGFDYKFPVLVCLVYISYNKLHHKQFNNE